jgi:hypothetical protein
MRDHLLINGQMIPESQEHDESWANSLDNKEYPICTDEEKTFAN